MSRKLASAAIAVTWLLAAAVALAAARYFLNPVPLLLRTQSLALARHPAWLLLHIACGVAAIVAGPFQFVASLRASHPAVHRASGYVYLAAVLLGGCAGLRLSADTAQFAADGLNDNTAFELIGLVPTALGFAPNTTYDPSQFFLVVLAFAALSITWIVTSAAALVRARQRRFADHRAWMMRSYSLTFAAVTVRLMALPLFFVTQDPVVAITLTFWSWVLNLMVAEWLVRRALRAVALRPLPPVDARAPKRKAKTRTWNMLIPESPACPMPMPRAATTARIHSPIDMWGVAALHDTDLVDPAPTRATRVEPATARETSSFKSAASTQLRSTTQAVELSQPAADEVPTGES